MSKREINKMELILEKAIEGLPESYRAVLIMRDVKKLSYDEICKKLEEPKEIVKRMVKSARTILDKTIARMKKKESHEEQTDEELIKIFQEGDQKAHDLLVHRYKDKILIHINGYMQDLTASEDLANDTLMKLFTHGHTYKPIAKFSTWIYTVAGNMAKTELRKLQRRKTDNESKLSRPGNDFSFDRMEFVDYVDDSLEGDLDENVIILRKAMSLLSEDFRVILTMRDYQELSYDDISTILDLAEGTVKSRINRARIKLADICKEIKNR